MAKPPRLWVDAPLAAGARVALAEPQAHYLTRVMRLPDGAPVAAFNGRDGEWRACLERSGRQAGLAVEALLRPQEPAADLWLAFAPPRGERVDTVVEKATELGVGRFLPVVCRRSVVRHVNLRRLRATAVEAAEQCERLTVPEVADPLDLGALLAAWPAPRPLYFCDEARAAPALLDAVAGRGAAGGLLVGPEGGFDPDEADLVRRRPFAVPVSLGRFILRADTAAIVAVALWQAAAAPSGTAGTQSC